jgi:hypothetical protein
VFCSVTVVAFYVVHHEAVTVVFFRDYGAELLLFRPMDHEAMNSKQAVIEEQDGRKETDS